MGQAWGWAWTPVEVSAPALNSAPASVPSRVQKMGCCWHSAQGWAQASVRVQASGMEPDLELVQVQAQD